MTGQLKYPSAYTDAVVRLLKQDEEDIRRYGEQEGKCRIRERDRRAGMLDDGDEAA